ncbi:MAG: hypothetical protein JJ895_07045 [Balneolaceae bacterium]|nr:hypothetical protein [Balneolaceae bacterium]
MLRFFRQIRQKLLENGNIRKYFWYALGEILLVMIGILLALQVNNWNEDNKAREYERTLLTELRVDIKNDIDFFGDHLLNNRNAYKRDVVHHYFEQMIKGEEVDASKFNNYLIWLKYHNTFNVNDGAYESIKSSGIDKISNREIRSFITNFYEFQIPRYEELIDFSVNELIDARENDLPELLGTPKFDFNSGLEIVEQPVNFDIHTNLHFIRLLEKSIQFEKSSTRTYTSMLEMYNDLDSLLVVELGIQD